MQIYLAFSLSLCRQYSMVTYVVKVGLTQRPGMGLFVLLALQKFPPKVRED